MTTSLQIMVAEIHVYRRMEKATLDIYSNVPVHLLNMGLLWLI